MPLVVDLGFGSSAVTTVELFRRLQSVRPDLEVVGIEIDSSRVDAASACEEPGLSFRRGGFEMPLGDLSPAVVRALNVLRQYDEPAALDAWTTMLDRLAPDGLLVEGTCDEIGRRACWVALRRSGPESLTLSAHLASLSLPSELAERLPKALIHHNVPGQPIHAFLTDFDRAWAAAAPFAPFGPRQRWVAAVSSLASSWPLIGGRSRWRLGEVTVAWDAVRPAELP